MGWWKKFTGEATFEEAERRYAALIQRVERKYQQYKKDYDKYANEIETHVQSINQSKIKIKTELFPQMAHMMRRIKDFNVNQSFDLTQYEDPIMTPLELRSRQELYRIDFDKHRFKSNFLAVITLGIVTRKRAKETLEAVKEEEARVKYDLQKYEAQLTKLRIINATLRDIDGYFLSLVEIYSLLLERLDSSVKLLYIKCVSISKRLLNESMSINNLPLVCRNEVRAVVTCSKILKQLVETKLTIYDDSEVPIARYKEEMNKQRALIIQQYNVA